MINSLDFKNSWGLYSWFNEDDPTLIYSNDLEDVRN